MIKDITIEQLREILSAHGIKMTSQRLAIYSFLCESDTHPSAEQLHAAIHVENPTISLGTVYKTLETFTEIGLVSRVQSADGKYRFDARKDPHYHLHCLKSHRIIDFNDAGLRQVVEEYLGRKAIQNFSIQDVQINITGQILDNSKDVKYS